MAATAGWNTTIKVGGTPTAVTGEACTNTTGNTYQINNTAKRVWDPSVVPIAYDGGVPAAILSADYLLGTVTLAATPGGAVTVDVTYIPLLSVAQAKAASVDMALNALDVSVYGSRDMAYLAGLRTFTASISTLDTLETDLDSGGDTWTWNAKADGTMILVEIDMGGLGSNRIRFWSFVTGLKSMFPVDGVISGDIELQATPIRAADASLVTITASA